MVRSCFPSPPLAFSFFPSTLLFPPGEYFDDGWLTQQWHKAQDLKQTADFEVSFRKQQRGLVRQRVQRERDEVQMRKLMAEQADAATQGVSAENPVLCIALLVQLR